MRHAALAAILVLLAPPESSGGAEPVRRALVIGVSGYERPGTPDGWWALHTENDVQAVTTLLTRSFGFAEPDVRVLKAREETTHEAIVGALRELIDATQPGDVVFVHYSGHGSEIPDDNGDELDGRDECLVPSDYVSKNDGSNNIRDDALGRLLDDLAARKPGSVTLVFDCCFSGTATRDGRLIVRGQSWTGPAPSTTRAGSAERERGGGLLPGGYVTSQGMVVLSATSQGQVAHETQDPETGKVMGLLTWAFVQGAAAAHGETTHRDLYESILAHVSRENHEQTPQIEGPLDRVLFGGKVVAPLSYVPLSVSGDGAIYLEAGSLQGMTLGSRFRLFGAGTHDFRTATPLAEATIARLDLNYAVLEAVDGGALDPTALVAGRAVEVAHVFGDNRLRVRMDGLDEGGPALSALAVLETGDQWDLRLRRAGDAVFVERQDGSRVDSLGAGPSLLEGLRLAVEGEARWRFLNEIRSEDPEASVRLDLRMAAVEPQRDAQGRITGIAKDLPLPSGDSGTLTVPAGTHVVLELRNRGFMPAYVTALDLRPDGRVGPLWPYPGVRIQDNKIPADGAWHRVGFPFVFRIDDAGHREVWKAIATAEPADFSPLLDKRLLVERSERDPQRDSPLGRLFSAVTLGERCDASAVPVGDWATAEVRFEVTAP